jgi:hypothetical protein
MTTTAKNTISFPHSALLLVGNIDILGAAMCTLGNNLAENPIMQMWAELKQDRAGLDSSSFSADCGLPAMLEGCDVPAAMKKLESDIVMISPMIQCLRQLRDLLADANGISADAQYKTAAYTAEQIAAELESE